ncbi:MAG: PadR family transcriptional regulator [Candidatus Bathyarchaeota archaeon]|nr:PadR family transcriptional regulator [Candidatus Termiticorpusculum sp.]
MIYKNQKEIQAKLTKNLLDMIVLRLINHQAMHGYQVITQIRKIWGIYFGPSTVYPLLSTLEKKGYIISKWNMTADKPRKIFTITNNGKARIKSAENTLNLICKTLNTFEPPSENTNENTTKVEPLAE